MKKKANQKLNARMTESVCYVITSQLLRSRIGRSSSWRIVSARAGSVDRARGPSVESNKWGAVRERRPGAACGLDSCALLSPHSPRSPRNHIIYDSIRARSKLAVLYQLPNNNSFFLSCDLTFFSAISLKQRGMKVLKLNAFVSG